MTTFKLILEQAAKRVGGAEALEAELIAPHCGEELRAIADDRYLSLMSLRVFRAGLKPIWLSIRIKINKNIK